MPQSMVGSKYVDVDSSDEGTTPHLNINNNSSIGENSDLNKATKKGKKGKKDKKVKAAVEAFDNIEFSASLNPFDSDTHVMFDDDKKETKVAVKYIHIRLQQVKKRKFATSLQGLPTEFDLKELVKHFKKTYGCFGIIVDDDEFGNVIQLSGDQCTKLVEFLVGEGIAKKSDIQVHGL
ncbi:Eukaryotic translation initiation factor eIF-1 [Coemansia sp. RSA 1972]|nr:Eukaryotic translation initiation factor eIF-1 [Coemansia sp. RSA 1972]